MTTQRPRLPARYVGRGHARPRRRAQLGMCLATIALTIVSVSVAHSARADTGDDLRAAIAAARGTACGPLRSDPVIDQAAAAINGTTDKWINNASRAVPETDALPLLKELGYGGSKATILSGAAKNDGDAIKGLLLEGYAKVPDCSYADFGVSALYNAKKDMILTTVVLAA
jgi:hypothetical protein